MEDYEPGSRCIFCAPYDHMRLEQVLLSTDSFHLIAGIGPLVEGYIIIVPHRCDWRARGLKSFSEASVDLIDELLFLRGIVIRFYREVYGFEGGLFFEHGRAGACGTGETPHCYHAHLCCFPVPFRLGDDVRVAQGRVVSGVNLQDLGATVLRNPCIVGSVTGNSRERRPRRRGAAVMGYPSDSAGRGNGR